MADINKKAIEAAALGIINCEREYHGLDPILWDFPALSSWHKERALRQARNALIAAQPYTEAAITPLRAREEIARTRAKFDWPVAPKDEQDAWVERHWRDHLELADAILSGTAGQEWREPLVEFARWAISGSSFVGSDLNGGDIQDKAEKLGILIKTKYDPAIHSDHEEAEPGDDWYMLAPFLAEKSQS